MDDSRILSKTAPFSFENGLVWTGPKYFHYLGLLTILTCSVARINTFLATIRPYIGAKTKIALKFNESHNVMKIRFEIRTESCQQTHICFISYPKYPVYENYVTTELLCY